ncbi:MAG TPA: hypothetical protein PKL34_04700, partial [Candidatus Cloacimonadota bacterium]|nr:hypothetical protein [Candidatus Cloacimonadota bacterium]
PMVLRASDSPSVFPILSEDETLELHSMLGEADLVPAHTKFYRDWDPYARLKSDWHMRTLQDGLDAIPLFSDLREVMYVNYHEPICEHLFDIAFGVKDISTSESRFHEIGSIAEKVKKPGDIFLYLERAFTELEPLLRRAFGKLSAAELDTLGLLPSGDAGGRTYRGISGIFSAAKAALAKGHRSGAHCGFAGKSGCQSLGNGCPGVPDLGGKAGRIHLLYGA